MSRLKVKDQSHLYRDSNSNAIINTDKSQYDLYITRREKQQSENSKIEHIENDLNMLKSDINDIKSLLMEIKNGSL
jgi:hypothetical protein